MDIVSTYIKMDFTDIKKLIEAVCSIHKLIDVFPDYEDEEYNAMFNLYDFVTDLFMKSNPNLNDKIIDNILFCNIDTDTKIEIMNNYGI